jgi:hypothetical protein
LLKIFLKAVSKQAGAVQAGMFATLVASPMMKKTMIVILKITVVVDNTIMPNLK